MPLSASECLAQVEDLAELERNRAELARRIEAEAARRAAAERVAAASAAAAAAHDDAFEEELLEKRNLTMIAPARLIAWRARVRKRHTERISKKLDSEKAMGGEVGHSPVAAPVAGAAPSEPVTPATSQSVKTRQVSSRLVKTSEPVTPATSQSVKFGAATTSSPVKTRQVSSQKSAKSILQRASAAALGTGAPLHVDSVPLPPPPPPGPPTIAFVRREEDDADLLDHLEGMSRKQKVGESAGVMAEMMLARARTNQPKEQGGAAVERTSVEQAVPTTHGEGWAKGKALWSTAKGAMRTETQVQKEPRAHSPNLGALDVPRNPPPTVHQRTAELSTDADGGAPSSQVLAGQMKAGKHRRKDMWKEVRAALSCLLSGLLNGPLMAPLINGSLDGPTHQRLP